MLTTLRDCYKMGDSSPSLNTYIEVYIHTPMHTCTYMPIVAICVYLVLSPTYSLLML